MAGFHRWLAIISAQFGYPAVQRFCSQLFLLVDRSHRSPFAATTEPHSACLLPEILNTIPRAASQPDGGARDSEDAGAERPARPCQAQRSALADGAAWP